MHLTSIDPAIEPSHNTLNTVSNRDNFRINYNPLTHRSETHVVVRLYIFLSSYFQHGNTALHYAAKGGYLDILEYLKKENADLNVRNEQVGDSDCFGIPSSPLS